MAPAQRNVQNAGAPLARAARAPGARQPPKARQAPRGPKKIILGKVPQQEWKFDTTENIVYMHYQSYKMERILRYSNPQIRAILKNFRVATKDEISTRVVGKNFYVEEEQTGRLFRVQSFRITDQLGHIEVEWMMKRKSEQMMDEEEKEREETRRAERVAVQQENAN